MGKGRAARSPALIEGGIDSLMGVGVSTHAPPCAAFDACVRRLRSASASNSLALQLEQMISLASEVKTPTPQSSGTVRVSGLPQIRHWVWMVGFGFMGKMSFLRLVQ